MCVCKGHAVQQELCRCVPSLDKVLSDVTFGLPRDAKPGVSVYMYLCKHVCMHLCMYVCMHVSM